MMFVVVSSSSSSSSSSSGSGVVAVDYCCTVAVLTVVRSTEVKVITAAIVTGNTFIQ